MAHYMKQGDRRPAMPATIRRGDQIVNLSDATSVTFKMRGSTGSLKVNSVAVITDAVNGEVEYRWASGDTDEPGDFPAEWEVLWSDGTNETFPTVGFDIVHIHGDLDS